MLAGTDWSVIWYLGVEVTCCGDCAYLQFRVNGEVFHCCRFVRV